jgi:hypothetical protein
MDNVGGGMFQIVSTQHQQSQEQSTLPFWVFSAASPLAAVAQVTK